MGGPTDSILVPSPHASQSRAFPASVFLLNTPTKGLTLLEERKVHTVFPFFDATVFGVLSN